MEAHLVDLAEEYAHSSARHYVHGTSDGVTTTSPLYESFGNTESSRLTAYRFFLGQLDEKEEARFDDMGLPQGDDALRGGYSENAGGLSAVGVAGIYSEKNLNILLKK